MARRVDGSGAQVFLAVVAVSVLAAWSEWWFGAILVLAFASARWTRRPAAIVALVVLTAASAFGARLAHDSVVPYLLLPVLGWVIGRALNEREVILGRLDERARELEAEQDAYAELSVRYERARIAAELHDIVAHAISVMVVQASAGQRTAATDPEATTGIFGAISGAARQAEEEMGRLVMLLADDEMTGDETDLELVKELVDRAAATGFDVTLTLEGSRAGLSSAVAQTATRVVQEGLTNALRYASGAAARVVIRTDGDALVVEVVNAPATDAPTLAGHGTGNGLRGLRERVSACGGQLEAGPTGDGGWRTRAQFPRTLSATAA